MKPLTSGTYNTIVYSHSIPATFIVVIMREEREGEREDEQSKKQTFSKVSQDFVHNEWRRWKISGREEKKEKSRNTKHIPGLVRINRKRFTSLFVIILPLLVFLSSLFFVIPTVEYVQFSNRTSRNTQSGRDGRRDRNERKQREDIRKRSIRRKSIGISMVRME